METEKILKEMTLREKVGQLFQVGFSGMEMTAEVEELIEDYGVGGIIYFRRNIKDSGQLSDLSRSLQEKSKIPLLISIDQEGGTVTRLRGDNHFPGQMALGAANCTDLTRQLGEVTGQKLLGVGVNMNLAPVLDVNNNPKNPVIGVRSFGEDPEEVACHGTAYIEGLQRTGVIACGKHFPGHGDTAVDSHHALPSIEHSLHRLERVELYPFFRAIEAGVESIMTAHVSFPAIEPEPGWPATVSEAVLTHLLREKLGFSGLIITDCMEMKAISETLGTAEGAVQTLKAGSDTVLISHNSGKQKEALERVIAEVERGGLDEEKIEASVRRILDLKSRKLTSVPRAFSGNRGRELSEEIARKAVTLVSDGKNNLPLRESGIALVTFGRNKHTPVEDAEEPENLLPRFLKQEGYSVSEYKISHSGELSRVPEDLPVLFSAYYARGDTEQLRAVAELEKRGQLRAVAALTSPYDLEEMPRGAALLTTYDYSPACLKALAEVISGRLTPRGRLPVSLSLRG